jgi:hypothetical protein
MKPWTPQTKWDDNAGKANICGEKEVNEKNNLRVPCNFGEGGWSNTGGSDKGTLTIENEGVYDVYFVKYAGRSEFKVDKGFGKDFAMLPQTLVVGNPTPGGGRRGVMSKAARAALKNQNRRKQRQSQKEKIAKKLKELQAQQLRIDAAAAKAAAKKEDDERPRSVFFPLVIKGLLLSEFTMKEETGLKSVLAEFAGAVCTPDPKKDKKAKYVNCTVREAWVQRIGNNVTTPLANGAGIVVFARVATNESAAVPGATAALSQALKSGRILQGLQKAGGSLTRRSKGLSVEPYIATEAINKLGTLPPSPPPTFSPALLQQATKAATASDTARPSFAAAMVAAIIAARALKR